MYSIYFNIHNQPKFVSKFDCLFTMHSANLQRAFIGNNCSSTVMLVPGLQQAMLMEAETYQISDARAKFSV